MDLNWEQTLAVCKLTAPPHIEGHSDYSDPRHTFGTSESSQTLTQRKVFGFLNKTTAVGVASSVI